MKIGRFFEDVLGANLANTRWSWGAVDPVRNIVYLRIWDDQIGTVKGKNCVHVYWKKRKSSSPGLWERVRHIDMIRAGAQAVGVVCTAEDPSPDGPRAIKQYQHEPLVRLGELFGDDAHVYAVIEGELSLEQLARHQTGESTLATDLRSISRNKKIDKTGQEALINARLGQGQFRANLLERWDYQCAVTGVSVLEAVRASHIKPWSKSTNEERLDVDNGVPLIANLDALFDNGLISFAANGRMLISDRIKQEDRQRLNTSNGRLRAKPSEGMATYLDYHREKLFRA
jgi:putative restriction endonuclease